MAKVTIKKRDELPSTNNAWGFGGSRNKVRFIMSNGDVWVSGIACTRHQDEKKYIQKSLEHDPNWTGGWMSASIDIDLRGKPETWLRKHYEKIERKK